MPIPVILRLKTVLATIKLERGGGVGLKKGAAIAAVKNGLSTSNYEMGRVVTWNWLVVNKRKYSEH